MNTYKITNITNLANKRDLQYNTILNIDYVDEMNKKTIKVKPGETVYLKISSLPLSVHKLRVKKLVSVVEITSTELNNRMNANKPVIPQPIAEHETTEESERKSAGGKKKRNIEN